MSDNMIGTDGLYALRHMKQTQHGVNDNTLVAYVDYPVIKSLGYMMLAHKGERFKIVFERILVTRDGTPFQSIIAGYCFQLDTIYIYKDAS